MKIIMRDSAERRLRLQPLTYSRPAGALRCGIFTIAEGWERALGYGVEYLTAPYLKSQWPVNEKTDEDCISIRSTILADENLARAIAELSQGEALYDQAGERIALKGKEEVRRSVYKMQFDEIKEVYDIFLLNGKRICHDFRTLGPPPQTHIPEHVRLIGERKDIYISEDAKLCACIINATEGPVYVGPGARVDENAILRGPVAVCAGSRISMAARLYDGVTVGPVCKVGGEVDCTVFQGYSNKAHDGYLGNAVIGEWCNIGAGANASNLKNDYSPIRLWNYAERRFSRTGMQFCGLIMGDHSKIGVGTMINTATMIGVGCNIHGAGFPRNYIKSFSEGGASGFTPVAEGAFLKTAKTVMARRGIELTPEIEEMWREIRLVANEIEN